MFKSGNENPAKRPEIRKILTPELIHQPKGALIVEKPKAEDWEVKLGAEEPEINPDGDWRDDIVEYELQRNSRFDAYNCVTQSLFNKVQCIIKHCWNIVTNWSKRASAVLNGTKWGVGNSVNNPCEHLRKKGAVKEDDYPSMTDTMTKDEFYQPVPKELWDKECFLKDWAYTHKYLPRYDGVSSTVEMLKWGLKRSPVMCSVEGFYKFDNRGRVIYGGTPIAHEVLIVKIEGDIAYVLDSENAGGLIPFDIKYKFAYPKIGFIQKLNQELNIKSMSIEGATLIRGNESGKIYLLAGGIKHWIKEPKDFLEFFGEEMWKNEEWNKLPDVEIEPIPQGDNLVKPLAPGLQNIVNLFIEQIKKVGKKLAGKN